MYFSLLKETFHWNGNKSEHVSHGHTMPRSMLSYSNGMLNAQCPAFKLKKLFHLLNRLMERKTITCTSVIINKILCTVGVLCVVVCHRRWRFRLVIFLLVRLELLTVLCSVRFCHIWIEFLWKIHIILTEYCILYIVLIYYLFKIVNKWTFSHLIDLNVMKTVHMCQFEWINHIWYSIFISFH